MMNKKLREGLPPPPARMRHLPIDARGYPVPWFVHWVDGKPDFRTVDPVKFEGCLKHGKCWICGDIMGGKKTFVLGPLNILNRVTSEPPSHWECALYAVTVCPFLILPKAQYKSGAENYAPGQIMRNPGVCAMWSTAHFKRATNPRLLIVGEPTQIWWFSQGQLAQRGPVAKSLEEGLPILWKMAKNAANYADYCVEIEQQWAAAQKYLPKTNA
jgi:hypothetical protein